MVWLLLFQHCLRHEPTRCLPVAVPGGVYLAEWQCQINAQSFPPSVRVRHFCWVGPSPEAEQVNIASSR